MVGRDKIMESTISTKLLACSMSLLLLGCSSNSTENSKVSTSSSSADSSAEVTNNENNHIYDTAEIKDVMNGSRTEKIGEYSICKVNSEELTLDELTDWYFNYVEKNDFNYSIILYTDKDDNSGVYAIKGSISKDVTFEKDSNGDYMLGSSSNATDYAPQTDGTLKEW